MPVADAQIAIGTLLQVGDGGVGAGVKASKTIGASNQMLKVSAKTAGTAGNSKTFGIVVAGNNTAYSQVITANSVLINSATDGGGAATTTVDHAIAQLYLDATFQANFDASTTGNGTGVLLAGASAALSGGAPGAEVFTTIGGVESIAGPNFKVDIVDVTHMDSPSATKEFIAVLLDSGELSFDIQLKPGGIQHRAILTDMVAKTKRNFQLVFPDSGGSTLSMAGYYTDYGVTEPLASIVKASVKVKLTSLPTWTV